jgi:cation diffusion facilitator family transporter
VNNGRVQLRLVAAAGIVASLVLSVVNIIVGLQASSRSVLATGIEFAGDVLASSLVLVSVIVASRPADDQHPYGHGRIETLSAFVLGMMLMIAGAGVSWTSLQGMSERHSAPGSMAIVALVCAIVVRAVMATIKFRVGRRESSAALVADAWNDSVDIIAATTALVAVGLAMYDTRFLAADHYGGFAVGVIVVITGLRVLRDASLELMDTMPAREKIDEIRRVAMEVDGVWGVDKTYARKTGFTYHVDLHIEVDPALTVAASHQIAGHVRSLVRTRLPWVADVLVHVEPGATSTSESRGSGR